MSQGSTYTCSTWTVPVEHQEAFLRAFQQFAHGATELGGANEGFVSHDNDDPTRFIVVRRWDSPEAVSRWSRVRRHAPHTVPHFKASLRGR